MSIDWSQIVSVEKVVEWLLSTGIQVIIIVVGALIVIKLGSFITKRVERAFDDADPTTMNEREKQAATLGKVIRSVIRGVVWGIAVLMILKELGIEIGPILAGVGVAGLAVGFGAQSLVKDFLAGMFVLIENQYHVGDVVSLAGKGGLVERVTLRATTIRDLHGNVHVIPNGTIDVVTNMTKEYSRYVLDVGVAYKEDVDRVMDILKEVFEELAADPDYSSKITEPLEVLGVEDFGDSAVVVRVRFTTLPIQQWGIAREYRRRIKKTFDARGIEIPFPHRTLYLGEGAPMDGLMKVRMSEDVSE